MFGGRSIEHVPVVTIDQQPDAARGVSVDISKDPQATTTRHTGPTIQSAEAMDYTLYITRKWTPPPGPPALWDPREVTVELLYGSGAVMKQELALGNLPLVGIAYHACVQSMRAIFTVQPQNALITRAPQDEIVAWIARGRPWRILSPSDFALIPAVATPYTIPAFARRITFQPQVVQAPLTTNLQVNFQTPGGTGVGGFTLQWTAGQWDPRTIIVPQRAAVMTTEQFPAGGVGDILGQWELDA